MKRNIGVAIMAVMLCGMQEARPQEATQHFLLTVQCHRLTNDEARISCLRSHQAQVEPIERKYPGWQKTLRSPEFRVWYDAQRSDLQALSKNPKVEAVIRLLDLYTEAQSRRAEAMTLEVLEGHHPGWSNAIRTREFENWYRAQPASIQALLKTPRLEDVNQVLNLYAQRSFAVPATETMRPESGRRTEPVTLEMLERYHPGWSSAVKTREFENWYQAQPASIQALSKSPRIEDANQMLNLYAQRGFAYPATEAASSESGFSFFLEILGAAIGGAAAGYNEGRAAAREAPAAARGNTPRPAATKVYTQDECSSDFSCGLGRKCVKGPGQFAGICMTAVDLQGLPKYSSPSSNSINPRSHSEACSFSTDCPVGFRCDSVLKACVK